MKTFIRLLIGLAILLVLFWVMSAITGFLFWGGVALVVGAIVLVLLRGLRRRFRKQKGSSHVPQRRIEKDAAQTIEELTRELERQRTRE